MLKYRKCVTYTDKNFNSESSLFQFQNKISVFSNYQGFRSQGPPQAVVRKGPPLLETLIISKFRLAFMCCVGFLKLHLGKILDASIETIVVSELYNLSPAQ